MSKSEPKKQKNKIVPIVPIIVLAVAPILFFNRTNIIPNLENLNPIASSDHTFKNRQGLRDRFKILEANSRAVSEPGFAILLNDELEDNFDISTAKNRDLVLLGIFSDRLSYGFIFEGEKIGQGYEALLIEVMENDNKMAHGLNSFNRAVLLRDEYLSDLDFNTTNIVLDGFNAKKNTNFSEGVTVIIMITNNFYYLIMHYSEVDTTFLLDEVLDNLYITTN